MQDSKIASTLLARAKELLSNGTVQRVAGWRKDRKSVV